MRLWRTAALLLAIALMVLFAVEARLPARLGAKLHPKSFQAPDAVKLAALKAETRRQLDALPAVPRFALLEGSRTEAAVTAWRVARPVNTWPNACLAAGVLASAQAGGAEADFAALQRFADRCVTPDGKFREPLHGVEQAMIGPVLLELARRDGGQRYRTAALEQLVQAAVTRQQPDGLWRWCLAIPEGDADTSGSAMLAWAIERGCRCGALPAKYLDAARRANAGLLRLTDQAGVVSQALGECQAVGHYPRVFGAYPWAQGPATAALAWNVGN